MNKFKQFPLHWYAQSPTIFYSATKIEYIADRVDSIAKDGEEFKSDEYLTIKNLSPQGIYRYGISNNISAKDQFLDFYFQDITEDFHYKTLSENQLYGISVTFKYKDSKSQDRVKTFNHFSQYLTFSKSQKKIADVKLTDIFVYKFGHADVSLGSEQTLTHDGYSVGFKASLQIDNTRFAEICIRGNITFEDPKPNFHIIITPNFNCECCIELYSDDINYLEKQISEPLIKDQQKLFCIERNKYIEDIDLDKEQIKNDYKSIARFIDWNEVPLHLRIDWKNDDIETIGYKFLKWESHLKSKPDFIVKTKYFDINDNGLFLYHNNNFYDYIILSLFIKENGIDRGGYSLGAKSTYVIDGDIVTMNGTIENLSYIIKLIGNDEKLPTISLTISTTDKVSFWLEISSPLPFHFKHTIGKYFTLDNETLEFTTID